MTALRADLPLLWRQIRSQNRTFWRTPVAAFFTLALPVFFLALFSVLFGGSDVTDGYRFAQFFAPAMAVFAACSATFTNLSIGTAFARDQGILKRVRGTPLSPWIYMAGRIGFGVWIAVISVACAIRLAGRCSDSYAMGKHRCGAVRLRARYVHFLGAGIVGVRHRQDRRYSAGGDQRPVPADGLHLRHLHTARGRSRMAGDPGRHLPAQALRRAFGASFNPFHTGPVLGWENLATMGAWLVLGLVITTRFFSWDPRGSR